MTVKHHRSDNGELPFCREGSGMSCATGPTSAKGFFWRLRGAGGVSVVTSYRSMCLPQGEEEESRDSWRLFASSSPEPRHVRSERSCVLPDIASPPCSGRASLNSVSNCSQSGRMAEQIVPCQIVTAKSFFIELLHYNLQLFFLYPDCKIRCLSFQAPLLSAKSRTLHISRLVAHFSY